MALKGRENACLAGARVTGRAGLIQFRKEFGFGQDIGQRVICGPLRLLKKFKIKSFPVNENIKYCLAKYINLSLT